MNQDIVLKEDRNKGRRPRPIGSAMSSFVSCLIPQIGHMEDGRDRNSIEAVSVDRQRPYRDEAVSLVAEPSVVKVIPPRLPHLLQPLHHPSFSVTSRFDMTRFLELSATPTPHPRSQSSPGSANPSPSTFSCPGRRHRRRHRCLGRRSTTSDLHSSQATDRRATVTHDLHLDDVEPVGVGVGPCVSAGVSQRVSSSVSQRVSEGVISGVSQRVSSGVGAGVSQRVSTRCQLRCHCGC